MNRKNLDDLEENGQVGDWCFINNYHDIFLRYPESDERWAEWHDCTREEAPELNRGDIVHLPINLGGNTTGRWGWDGNIESPTITPSINVIGRWHGWLRNGILETA